MAMRRECGLVSQVPRVVCEREDIHLMARRDGAYLMESADFIALVRRIRDAVAKVKNSQNFPKIW